MLLKSLKIACLFSLLLRSAVWAEETQWTPVEVLQWISVEHPQVTAAQLRREGAESYLKGAGKQPNPEIKLSLSRGTVQEDANALSQRFEIAGQPALRKKIASSLFAQAGQETILVSRKVALEALTSYYQVWMSRRALEIAAVNHELALQLEEISARRLSAGQVSQDEHRQTRLIRLSALATLQQNATNALASEENFRALLGFPDQQRLRLPGGPKPPVLEEASLPSKEEIIAKLDQLPEIELAQAKASQAKLEADLAGKAGAPDLYLYAYRANTHRIAEQGVQFGVSFPLFDWGQLGAEHRQKKLQAKSLEAEAEASRRSLKAQLFKALELCRGQIRYVKLLENQFQEREVLAHHSLVAYEFGLISLLEAVDTQKNYQLSLLELAQEAVVLETQRVSLHLAIKETL